MHGAEVIPAEAVEAAAKGIWQYYETSAASNSAEPTNEDMAIARAALEAAAPYMLATAWDEGHDAAADELAKYENPYRPTDAV